MKDDIEDLQPGEVETVLTSKDLTEIDEITENQNDETCS